MTSAHSRTLTTLVPSRTPARPGPSRTAAALTVPKGSGLATALEILTVVASLALGAGFFGSLWLAPSSAGPAAEAVRSCPAGTATC